MSAPLPHGVLELWTALDTGPSAAHQVFAAVMEALQAPNPRTTFNNKMRGLRARSSRPLHELRDWLRGGEAYLQASKNGGYWALRKWQRALDKMIDHREPAHKAFAGDKGGRRITSGFTPTERAAIHSEYRKRAGVELNRALAEYTWQVHASGGPAPDGPDERDVRRARTKLQLRELTYTEVQTLAVGPAGGNAEII